MIQLPTAKKWVEVILILALIAVVVPFVVFAVPQVIGADESFVVLSGSMEPRLSPGDVVVVDASAPIRENDIITYTTAGTDVPTTHRVVSVVADGYETKGDANENKDAVMVSQSAVLGRVVLVAPLMGHVLLWTNTGFGYLALVVIPLTLLGLNELRNWIRRESNGNDPVQTTESRIDETALAESVVDEERGPFELATVDEMDRIESEATAERTVDIAVIDLKLAALAMGWLFAYAGWNVFREFAAVSAPNPVSVGALTGGLLGLVFTGWVTATAWRVNIAATQPPQTSGPRTDGGESGGDDDA